MLAILLLCTLVSVASAQDGGAPAYIESIETPGAPISGVDEEIDAGGGAGQDEKDDDPLFEENRDSGAGKLPLGTEPSKTYARKTDQPRGGGKMRTRSSNVKKETNEPYQTIRGRSSKQPDRYGFPAEV